MLPSPGLGYAVLGIGRVMPDAMHLHRMEARSKTKKNPRQPRTPVDLSVICLTAFSQLVIFIVIETKLFVF